MSEPQVLSMDAINELEKFASLFDEPAPKIITDLIAYNEAVTVIEIVNDCLFGNTRGDSILEEAYQTAHDFLAKHKEV